MRYSKLAYLAKMSRTLLEAVRYLCTDPDRKTAEELLLEGARMLDQIRQELEEHQEDLKSGRPLALLSEIEQDWQVQSSRLEEELKQFIQCLPEEVRYQVRAVFFTGLGSTWDAMESVYQYMREDSRFDPVVVLIPIVREHEQDGETKREIIYEDYLTAKKIPFLGYNQYSMDKDCPDLAFTNQPYESGLLPEFWPVDIAKKTRLVYLPYYLAWVVDAGTVQNIRNGAINRCAWKIIFPTEKEYRHYCRYADNGGANALLTGLPKLDSIIALREKGAELPKGWERLNGKKIFLWNSWYILKFSSFAWVSELLEWFSQHEDCALIWRPHPMTDSVTKLYHPKDYEKYQNYINQAEKMNNVVLDREISCDAAFYYSDALISDSSSLLPQYLLMDKPALWIKNDVWGITDKEFIGSDWMEQTKNFEGILTFLEEIKQGRDPNAESRKSVRAKDLPLADGHAGERVCKTLLCKLKHEDFAFF